MLRTNHQKRSRLQERRAAEQYGGSVSPGSGNGWIRKADVRTPDYLIECKTTLKNSYSIKRDDWVKLQNQGLMDDRIPLMEIDLNGFGLVVMRKADFWTQER